MGSLYTLLHSPSCQLTWAQVIYLCLGAASGLAHLHRCGVVHRDVKSANLLVQPDLTVKVADFGLSRINPNTAAMTGSLGTYQWMAPEVIGNQQYSEKADVYSFGIVLWECTARQIPFATVPGVKAAMDVMNHGLRPEIPSYTPPALATLMQWCWQGNPEERPQMADVAQALKLMYASAVPTPTQQ